ncbi:hypothetical protein [Aeromonas dhakensis]|uniref:hypothetical protein n=1 Tax=Aeromonas dhakensis TaxID=196024 RepID=UPI00244D0DD0|nr:hypothetical protein [Aeromonas dhakensis]MDH0348208.1 hypothetical protein [Aeromonas dhakensis]
MAREFEHNGEWYSVDDYQPKHYLENQATWAAPGIPLNPCLRDDFDSTPNEERDDLELQHWWQVPYIVTYAWNEPSAEVGEEQREQWRVNWFKAWPTGVRYDVRRLDGGAWDRSTNRGGFPSLELAVAAAQALLVERR